MPLDTSSSSKKHRYENLVLGFTECATEETNDPEHFASKAGGKPVWIYRGSKYTPAKVPRCTICGQREMFVCQIYAPIEEQVIGHDEAFHRVLYITMCPSSGCMRQKNGQGASVIRGQLRRDNPCYSFTASDSVDDEGEDEDGNEEGIEQKEEVVVKEIIDVRDACVLCGFWGELVCGKCKHVRYCSKQCQREDWNLGHRDACQPISGNENKNDGEDDGEDEGEGEGEESKENHVSSTSTCTSSSSALIVADSKSKAKRNEVSIEATWRSTELEIFTDRHCTPPDSDTEEEEEEEEDDDDDDEEVDVDVEEEIKKAGATMQDASLDELPEELFSRNNGSSSENNDDKIQGRFRKVIGYEPDQVVRYERNGDILWASSEQRCNENKDINECELCGGKRIYEMQVMSQIVYMMQKEYDNQRDDDGDNVIDDRMQYIAKRLRNDMDWATIVIFTCENSCALQNGQYHHEMAWVQRFASS